jgi:hypothetical protein
MSGDEETFQQVPGDHVVSGDIEVFGDAPHESPAVSGGSERPRPLWIVPTLLGVSVLALNIHILASPIHWIFTTAGWGGPIALIALITSVFLGVFLIVYAILLSGFERSQSPLGLKADVGPRQGSWYLRWVVVPLVLALLAPLVTVWAIDYNRDLSQGSRAPKPCIELYQAAANTYKDNPNFRMPAGDPDQRRCFINQILFP